MLSAVVAFQPAPPPPRLTFNEGDYARWRDELRRLLHGPFCGTGRDLDDHGPEEQGEGCHPDFILTTGAPAIRISTLKNNNEETLSIYQAYPIFISLFPSCPWPEPDAPRSTLADVLDAAAASQTSGTMPDNLRPPEPPTYPTPPAAARAHHAAARLRHAHRRLCASARARVSTLKQALRRRTPGQHTRHPAMQTDGGVYKPRPPQPGKPHLCLPSSEAHTALG